MHEQSKGKCIPIKILIALAGSFCMAGVYAFGESLLSASVSVIQALKTQYPSDPDILDLEVSVSDVRPYTYRPDDTDDVER